MIQVLNTGLYIYLKHSPTLHKYKNVQKKYTIVQKKSLNKYVPAGNTTVKGDLIQIPCERIPTIPNPKVWDKIYRIQIQWFFFKEELVDQHLDLDLLRGTWRLFKDQKCAFGFFKGSTSLVTVHRCDITCMTTKQPADNEWKVDF